MIYPWDEPRSVVTPLVFGFRPPLQTYSGIADAFHHACRGVPPIDEIRKARVSRKETVSVRHSREVLSVPGIDGLYRRRARLIDRADTEESSAAVNRWVWEVGYTVFQKGALVPGVDAVLTPIVLDVSRFRLNRGAVRGGAQLALFRALLTQGLREFDPDLVVFGGQHEWDDSMWTFAVPLA